MKNSKGLFIKREYGRVPRKLKKQIPKDTVYCYKGDGTSGITWNEEYQTNVSWYGVKTCPFSTYKKYKDMDPLPGWMDQEHLDKYGEDEVNWCKLVKTDIEDRCKSCGLRYPKW